MDPQEEESDDDPAKIVDFHPANDDPADDNPEEEDSAEEEEPGDEDLADADQEDEEEADDQEEENDDPADDDPEDEDPAEEEEPEDEDLADADQEDEDYDAAAQDEDAAADDDEEEQKDKSKPVACPSWGLARMEKCCPTCNEMVPHQFARHARRCYQCVRCHRFFQFPSHKVNCEKQLAQEEANRGKKGYSECPICRKVLKAIATHIRKVHKQDPSFYSGRKSRFGTKEQRAKSAKMLSAYGRKVSVTCVNENIPVIFFHY